MEDLAEEVEEEAAVAEEDSVAEVVAVAAEDLVAVAAEDSVAEVVEAVEADEEGEVKTIYFC